MKSKFKVGDHKKYVRVIQDTDKAAFHGEEVHPVCSTFSLARDFEWTSRLFFLDMKEEGEEGVGTFLSIDHKSPAFVGEEVTYTATIVKLRGAELTCSIEAKAGDRIIATGSTGQKMLSREKLAKLFHLG